MFTVQVTSILDPDGRPAPGRQSWPVPWLEDGSVAPADLPQSAGRTLDFAWFDADEGHWPHRASWRFPSLPEPAVVMYKPAPDKEELAAQRFVVTVRIIRTEPSANHLDRRFVIGVTANSGLACEPVPDKPPESALPSGSEPAPATLELRLEDERWNIWQGSALLAELKIRITAKRPVSLVHFDLESDDPGLIAGRPRLSHDQVNALFEDREGGVRNPV
jgi:hypothetical protein